MMNSIELFAGAGGLALGTAKAGFSHKAIVEYDHDTCITLRENKIKGIKPLDNWNIQEADVREFNYKILKASIDLVAGGPPCQPFSIGGKHGAFLDRRDMFPEAVRAVRELRPKAFMFENVKGLLRESFAKYFAYVQLQLTYPDLFRKAKEDWLGHLSRLEKHHTSGKETDFFYRVVFRLLNAANYGVPQKRERVFIVGFRNDLSREWSFPEVTHSREALLHDKWTTGDYWERHKIAKKHRPEFPKSLTNKIIVSKLFGDGLEVKPWQTVRDAISDLPDPEKGIADSSSFQAHRLVPGARAYVGHTGSAIDEPAKTLKAGDHGVPGGENMILYPCGKVRYFTVRESARIQTFPDEYLFPVSWTESMRQLGNAVPVKLGYAVASSIKNCLEIA